MPNGQLDIGVGLGGATVFHNDPAVQNFAALMQAKKDKRDQELKDLTKEFSQASSAGIREQDKPEYTRQYMALQDLGRQKINEKDPVKKAMLQGQIDKGFQDLGEHVSRSIEKDKNDTAFANRLVDNRFRKQFTDDAVQQFIGNRNKALTDKSLITDYTTLQRAPDLDKAQDNFEKVNDHLKKNFSKDDTDPVTGEPLTPQEENMGGGLINVRHKAYVGKVPQATYYGMYLDADHDHMDLMRATYPDISRQYPDDKAFKQAVIPQMVKDNDLTTDKSATRKDEDYISKEERIRNAHADKMAALAERRADQADTIEARLEQKEEQSRGESLTPIRNTIPYAGGKFNIAVRNYVPLKVPNVSFEQPPDIDMEKGEISQSTKGFVGTIAGVQDVPIYHNTLSKGINPDYAGTPASEKQVKNGDADYKRMMVVETKDGNKVKRYLVDYDKLPFNVKDSPTVRKALAKLDETPVGGDNPDIKSKKDPLGLGL